MTNIKKLIARIESEPEQNFNMKIWHCGAAHCIGGWAETLMQEEAGTYQHFPEREIVSWLGIAEPEASELFYGWQLGKFSLSDITREHAIAALRHINRKGSFPGWAQFIKETT